MESIYEQLKKAGVPLEQRESELHVMVTPLSRAIIERNKIYASVFLNKHDHQPWYKIPYSYSG